MCNPARRTAAAGVAVVRLGRVPSKLVSLLGASFTNRARTAAARPRRKEAAVLGSTVWGAGWTPWSLPERVRASATWQGERRGRC